MKDQHVVIGGGPAGLTAALQLVKFGHLPTVLEQADIVGGLARTEQYKGYYIDMGGHRFFTKSEQVQQMWEELLGDDFLLRPRLSRIFYRQKMFDYPLKPLSTLRLLGPIESIRIIASYLRWQVLPYRKVETFEQWVTNRFGKRLFDMFFKSYTEKVWGISCDELRAEWAAQRIKDLSLGKAVMSMIRKPKNTIKTLIEEFHYPRLGPGMLWNRVKEVVEEKGGRVQVSSDVVRIHRDGFRIRAIDVEKNGQMESIPTQEVFSSMPVAELIKRMEPAPPAEVLNSAGSLRYRDFLTVGLIINKSDLFEDNWIYVHEPNVRVARIQNYKNWSPDMVPDSSKTLLGLEYFCNEGDELWRQDDADLIEQARQEVDQLGLAAASDVEDGCVYRASHAYPVYDAEYAEYLDSIRSYLAKFENLQTIGRNGLHRYNNQDHAMLTGIYAARNTVMGETTNLWGVNADQEYLEEIQEDRDKSQPESQQPEPRLEAEFAQSS